MTLGQKLTALRGDKPAQEVAAAIGITVISLLAYEAERRTPRDTIKLALANYYGLSLETLFLSHTSAKEAPQ